MSDTLLLNGNYLPLAVISRKKAFKLLCKDKVDVVSIYEDWFVNPGISVPAVVRLRTVVSFDAKIKFSRENVYIRDRHTCQYCGRNDLRRSELTFDHVLPKSRGGKTNFMNIVTACNPCNSGKADQTPFEARMQLIKPPKKPAHIYYAMYKVASTMAHPSWKAYTGVFSMLV